MNINIETLIQGGAVSIALGLVWLVHRMSGDFKEVIINHIDHSSEIQRKQTKWMQKLIDVIEHLDDRLNGKT